MVVALKDFEVLAAHGVNPSEKIEKQRFLISVSVSTDFEECAKDELYSTINYAAVKKKVQAFMEGDSVNLVETLALGIAKMILKEFALAKSVDVEVKKPDAPMSGTFDYVSARCALKWHRVYLSLGSSEGDKNAYLDLAVSALKNDDNVKNVFESSRIATEPYGGVAQGTFVNSALQIDTLYSPRQLLKRVNEIEEQGGRIRKERWGDRTLDIDIIFYDDLVVGDSDLCIPHHDMQYRTFVLDPLTELCPNKVHPLLNQRVRDLHNALHLKAN